MAFIRGVLAVVATACVSASAFAQADPAAYTAAAESTTRYNVNGSATIGGLDATAYSGCYVYASGGSQFRLNSLSVGIRRVGTATAPAPGVRVEVTVHEMTWDGTALGRGALVTSFFQQLDVSTVAVTQQVTNSWGDADPSLRPVINLQTQTQGLNGYGGFWVGVRFIGADAANAANGWRVVYEPTVGRSVNNFAVFNAATNTWGANYWFGQTADATNTTLLRDNPARFMLNVNGAMIDAVTPPADLEYGRSFEHTTYWRPSDALDGVGSKWFYSNCFTPAAAGDVLTPNKVVYGILRAGTATTPAPAVGVELALVQMNWDGTAYTPGTVVATQTFQLEASSVTTLERINWEWPNPATRPQVPLNTANAANAGLGGYFIAARMLGDTATLAGNSGPRIVYAPAVGASWHGFGMYSDTGVFTNYVFGNYAAGTAAGPVKPARFLTETYASIGPPSSPCPADLNGDGLVNASDLATLLGAWGGKAGDLDGDGTTGASDLAAILNAWGACP